MEKNYTYIGKRFGKKLYHVYMDDTGAKLMFDKPWEKFHQIGDHINATETEKGVKAPYTKTGRAPWEQIRAWSTEELNDMEKRKATQALKVKPEGHIDELINAIKGKYFEKFTSVERARMALYIYNKLIS